MGAQKGVPGIEVHVAEDRMLAEIRIDPGARPAGATGGEILAALTSAGVKFGVDEKAVERAADPATLGQRVAVAWGTPLQDPQDARVEYLFKTGDRPRLAEDDRGRVDYREMGLIENVKAGAVLARLHPAAPGRAGVDVFGRRTEPRAPRKADLEAGVNVMLSPARTEALAKVDGMVLLDPSGRIRVESVYHVSGDVGPETGNIEFVGPVIVRGSIRDGFVVKASGDVSVGDAVEGATVESGGSIRVSGGVVGRGKALLAARGSVDVRFAEDARIIAMGDVLAREALLRCHVVSGGSVRVEGGRGAVVGGSLSAEKGVAVTVLGGEGEVRTLVEAGIVAARRLRFDALEAEFAAARRRISEIGRETGTLEEARSKGHLPPDRLSRLDALIAERDGLRKRTAEIALEARATAAEAVAADPADVRASGEAHPGVTLAAAGQSVSLRNKTGSVRLRAVGGRLEKAT